MIRSIVIALGVCLLAVRADAAVINLTPCSAAVAPCTFSLLSTQLGQQIEVATGATGFTDTYGAVLTDFNHTGISGDDKAFAISLWLDSFTLLGGSGDGVMTVTWSLDGSLTAPSGRTAPGECIGGVGPGCSAGVGFQELFGVTSNLFGVGVGIGGGGISVTETGSFDVSFTYGVAFVGGFRRNGTTAGEPTYGGAFDFLHSGVITSVRLPTGATLTAASGTQYPTASAPEPASMLLLGTGLAGFSVRR